MNEEKPKSGLAIASMVLGILSLSCFGLLTGIPAIIMGHISYNRARKSPEIFSGTGFAIAGFVMGYVSILTTFILAGMMLPALAHAKERAQSITCVNNLKQIGLSARLYAGDHKDIFPMDFMAMKEEIGSPKVLVCPLSKTKVLTHSWSNFDPQKISYEMVSPGINGESPTTVFVRCLFHHHICYADGSVEQGRRK
ncbi:MAG: DUF4190 domain-containing protein [Verrucomicrobiota bacterium]